MPANQSIPELNFNRVSVRDVGKNIAEDIKKAKALILKNELSKIKLAYLSRQVGIYYAFYLSHKKNACEYLTITYNTLKNLNHNEIHDYQHALQKHALSFAEACKLLAYANTLDIAYMDSSLHQSALAFYCAEEKNNVDSIAFITKDLAVIEVRKGENTKAFRLIKMAINLLEKNAENPSVLPSVAIDLAECQKIRDGLQYSLPNSHRFYQPAASQTSPQARNTAEQPRSCKSTSQSPQ